MQDNPRFLIDGMLGNISKKLRFLGFDAEFATTTSTDDEVSCRAVREGRVLVTKDAELYYRTRRDGGKTILLNGDNEISHLAQIKREMEIKELAVRCGRSRCTACNGVLDLAERGAVADAVPQGVLDIHREFWRCTSCAKVYWEGTHVSHLQSLVDEVNR